MANISAIKLPDNSNYDLRASAIPFGIVDSSSTSTAFTVTVPGITALEDGVICMLKNGVVTSASGFTINVNGLGAKPVYSNMSAASAETTMFNVNYTMIFVYDETRVSGGCWVLYRGYNSNDNTIGYQIRTNSLSLPVSGATGRYRILFTSPDGTHFVPPTLSTSTNATSKRDVNTAKIDPFGRIVYYSSTTILSAEGRPGASSLWQQYTLTLGYSFNRTGAALTLTLWEPVYVKCTPQNDGSAIIDADTPYVQALPSTADGKIYILLGIAYSATNIELTLEHPVFEYKNGGIRQYTNSNKADLYTVNIGDNLGNDIYEIDKTYTEILTKLQEGTNVVVNDVNSLGPLPYLCMIPMDNMPCIVFGFSGCFGDDVATSGYLISPNNVATHVNQYITIPTTTSQLNNDSGFITGIDSSDVITALGYTPSDLIIGTTATTAAAGNHTHGNITNGGDITATAPTIASGDQIIINDNSASKITNGPTFDGSTTTTALTPKGTWETFSKFSGSYNDLTDKPTIPTNTDEKLKTIALTSATTYYPILATGANAAANRQVDSTLGGFKYVSTAGTTSVVGSAELLLGNATASGTANNEQGKITIYGTNAKKATITLAAPSADIALALPTSGGTLALASQIPSSTNSATTGITASTTATKTTLGTAGSVTGVQSTTTTASKVTLGTAFSIAGVSGSVSVRGVKTGDNSTTTASKVTVGSHSTDYGVKSAGSGSFTQGTFTGGSLVVTNHVLSFTPATHGADSHTHTAPTLGSKVPTVSASDITVPIRADADTTVPKAATAVSIPNVTGATDVTVPIKNTSATSIPNVSVASATVSITDPGHTHNI